MAERKAARKKAPAVPAGDGFDLTRSAPFDLTEFEAMMLKGQLARQQNMNSLLQQLQAALMEPINADTQKLNGRVEERLGLETGAVGTTHTYNFERLRLEQLPSAAPQPPVLPDAPVLPVNGEVDVAAAEAALAVVEESPAL